MKVLNTKNLLLYSFMFSSVFFFTKNECFAYNKKLLLQTPISAAQPQPIVQNQTIAQQPQIMTPQNQMMLPTNDNEQQDIENVVQSQNINNDEEIIRQIVLEEIRPLTTIQGNRIDKYKARVINVERRLTEQIEEQNNQQAALTDDLREIREQLNQQNSMVMFALEKFDEQIQQMNAKIDNFIPEVHQRISSLESSVEKLVKSQYRFIINDDLE